MKPEQTPREDALPVASAMECTGLVPALAEDGDAQAELQALMTVPPPKRQARK